jgi:hypothetical protein
LAITNEEVVALAETFHDVTMKAYLDCVMIEKGTAAEQQKFFLHPNPTLFPLRGDNMTLQQTYKLHQKLTDERHWSFPGTSPADQDLPVRGLDRAARASRRIEVRPLHQRLLPPITGRSADRSEAGVVGGCITPVVENCWPTNRRDWMKKPG